MSDTLASRGIEWGSAGLALPGEAESGDLCIVKRTQRGILMGVIDGLGHGGEAAAAARIAASTIEQFPDEQQLTLMQWCHERLQGTRGVVMTLASLNEAERTVTWIGVGNVDGVVMHRDLRAGPALHRMMAWGGVVGYQLPPLRVSTLPLAEGDLLIFSTDGVNQGFTDGLNLRDPAQKIADRICSEFGKGTDDALVLVLRYGGNTL